MVEVNTVKNDNRRRKRYNGKKHAIQNWRHCFRAFAYGAAFIISNGSFGWTSSLVAHAQTTTSSQTLSISSYKRHDFGESKHSSQQSTILENEVLSPRLNPPLLHHHHHYSFDEQPQPQPQPQPPTQTQTQTQTLPSNINARIYGGTPVDVLEYPYLVALFHKVGVGSISFKCGGVLLSPNVVLTAAHCAPVDVVFTGLHDMRWFASVNRDLYWKKHNVVQQVLHPGFSTNNLDNDLCLLRIVRDETWTSLYEQFYGREQEVDDTAYAQLNTDPALPVFGSTMRVIGWGATETGSTSTIPLDTTIQYGDNAYCNNLFTFPYILDSMMCGFSWNEVGNDACNGDSGGPLVLKGGGEDGRDLLVGIVSWGFDCGQQGYPGVYARVSENIEWMEGTVCGFSGVECVDGKLPQQLSATTPSPTTSSTVRVSSSPPTLVPSSISPTSDSPTANKDPPTSGPTRQPSDAPSATASNTPTRIPSHTPSGAPTRKPSQSPSSSPSDIHSSFPSIHPTAVPSTLPSRVPSNHPSDNPSATPSRHPSNIPSLLPTSIPSTNPSQKPSNTPSDDPTSIPSVAPTALPTQLPSTLPSTVPSTVPTYSPSTSPSAIPTQTPSFTPSAPPTAVPSAPPTSLPSVTPTTPPTVLPSVAPTHLPTNLASFPPSNAPTNRLEVAAQALVRSSDDGASDDYKFTVSFVTLFIISGVVFCTTCLLSAAIYKSL